MQADISWSVPSYIPDAPTSITYEIGYYVLQSNNCLPVVDITPQLMMEPALFNTTSNSHTITGLTANTCYLFGVRAYTVNGRGLWRVRADRTTQPASSKLMYSCM